MRSIRQGLAYALLAFVLTTGCGRGGEEPAPAPTSGTAAREAATTAPAAPEAARKFVIGFSQSNNEEPWRDSMNKAALSEAEKYKDLIRLEFADGRGDNNTQIANTENLLAAGIDLLIISPNEAPALTPVVRQAYESGVPVIVLDRAIQGDSYTAFIGADNHVIGQAAGRFVAETLNGEGVVLEIQGRLAATPTTGRHEGFHEILRDYPGIQVIGQQEGLYLRDKAKEIAENTFQTRRDIDLVYAHNDEMAIAAFLVARDLGIAGDILFVGIDGIPGPGRGVEAVMQGVLAATFLYPNCGREAIDTAVKILRGENVPKHIPLDTATITAHNAVEYSR